MKAQFLLVLASVLCLGVFTLNDKKPDNNDDDDITTLTFLVEY